MYWHLEPVKIVARGQLTYMVKLLNEFMKIIPANLGRVTLGYSFYSYGDFDVLSESDDEEAKEAEDIRFSNWLETLKAVVEISNIKTVIIELEMDICIEELIRYGDQVNVRFESLLEALSDITRHKRMYIKEIDELGQFELATCSNLRVMYSKSRPFVETSLTIMLQ